MSYRKKIIAIIVLCLFSFFLSLVLTTPDNFGLCNSRDTDCIHGYIDNFNNIAQVAGFFSISIFIISLILLFSREEIFHTWKKFAIIYILLSLIIITLAPTSAPNIISFDKESATLWLAVIFLIVSLAIIIVKTVKLRREER